MEEESGNKDLTCTFVRGRNHFINYINHLILAGAELAHLVDFQYNRDYSINKDHYRF